MTLIISPLTENHVEDAAKLVSHRYRQLCQKEPNLPPRYAQVDTLIPLLEDILQAHGQGVVAIPVAWSVSNR